MVTICRVHVFGVWRERPSSHLVTLKSKEDCYCYMEAIRLGWDLPRQPGHVVTLVGEDH